MSGPVTIGRAGRGTAIYCFEEHDGEVRYVGKTTQYLIDRRKAHLRPSVINGKLPVNRWLKKRRASCGFVTRLIEHVPPGGDWAARERHWIAHYRQDGHRLLNLTDGGDGLAGHTFSPEHRAKIAVALRTGADFSCETCGDTFWRKRRDIAKGNCRFCSRACYAKSLKGVPRPVPRSTVERGVSAAAAKRNAQTQCKRGHPLSGENLFRTAAGSRGCKECRRLHKIAYRERQRG